jgi:hypothetical protein
VLTYLAGEVVGEGGAPAAGGEGLLGDGGAEEDQPRPHLLFLTFSSSVFPPIRITDRPMDWAYYWAGQKKLILIGLSV